MAFPPRSADRERYASTDERRPSLALCQLYAARLSICFPGRSLAAPAGPGPAAFLYLPQMRRLPRTLAAIVRTTAPQITPPQLRWLRKMPALKQLGVEFDHCRAALDRRQIGR